VDVGNWGNSRAVNHPGQSGDPRSGHYRDLAASWLAGDDVPLLYSPRTIDAAAGERIVLVPR
jgi:penicillin amidase